MLNIWNQEPTDWRVDFSSASALSLRTEGPGRVLTVGLGDTPTPEILRQAAAKAIRTLHPLGTESVLLDASVPVRTLGAPGLSALASGAMLAQYARKVYKEKPERPLRVYVTGTGDLDAPALLRETGNVVQGIFLARDLTNCPPNLLTPEDLAREAVSAARSVGMETQVLSAQACRELGMGAFLAVGSSSAHAPCLIILRYRGGSPEEKPLGLVGKGVCFDSGGYCLKGKASLVNQKGDMAGGATVCGAMVALAANRVPVNVTALIPAVENRISPDSFLPGDVITSMSGKTIEVGNTDAEGRLILADAITYAIQVEKVDSVVDVATLTGSMSRMLGQVATGYFCNDEAFNARLLAAAERSGELFWRCPTFPEYRKLIESPVADLVNTADSCGAIAAGLFLEEFAGTTPWIHLDIAGTAHARSRPIREYWEKGATGVCVSTLYELCRGQA